MLDGRTVGDAWGAAMRESPLTWAQAKAVELGHADFSADPLERGRQMRAVIARYGRERYIAETGTVDHARMLREARERHEQEGR